MSELSDFMEILWNDESDGIASYTEFLEKFTQDYIGRDKEHWIQEINQIILDETRHAEVLEELVLKLPMELEEVEP